MQRHCSSLRLRDSQPDNSQAIGSLMIDKGSSVHRPESLDEPNAGTDRD